eukprot:1041482-Lingulodinium_polyedra.AAC.1
MEVRAGCDAKVQSAPAAFQRDAVNDGWVVMTAVVNDKGDRDVGLAPSDVFAASETGRLSTIRTTSTPEAT